MAERTDDPREYRGGVREPETAKGPGAADNEGIVPREMTGDDGLPPQEDADEQTLKDDVLGEVTGQDDENVQVDRTGGDQADATTADNTTEADTVHTGLASVTPDVGEGKA